MMNLKKISANKKKVTWGHDKWFKRWIDFPTLFIGCCWVGMLLLWPDVNLKDNEVIAPFKSMVVAHDIDLSEEDIYRRPDLIAMPSRVSFMPGIEDEEGMMVVVRNISSSCMLERCVSKDSSESPADAVALAAEAIRDAGGRARGRRSFFRSASYGGQPVSQLDKGVAGSGGILVWVSGSIGDDVVLGWSEADKADLFSGSSGWEVELSLTIGNNCLPEFLFLEKPSGDSLIDKGVVRALSRADLWQNVLPGVGSVLISFSPKVE